MPDLYNLARVVQTLATGLVSEALLLARSSLWQATNMANKRYVETSNYATFLAPFLYQLLPDACFLHITRRLKRAFSHQLWLVFQSSGQASRHGLKVPLEYPLRALARCPRRGPGTASALVFSERLFALVDSEPPARHIERVGRQLNGGATKPLDVALKRGPGTDPCRL